MGSSVITSASGSSSHNSSITKLDATATQMDVEDSSTASAPAASVLVHVLDPVQPQQSEPYHRGSCSSAIEVS